jgi:hypothetical protein
MLIEESRKDFDGKDVPPKELVERIEVDAQFRKKIQDVRVRDVSQSEIFGFNLNYAFGISLFQLLDESCFAGASSS